MKRIMILIFLAGCSPDADDYIEILKHCDSDIEVVLYKNSLFFESIEFSCTHEVPK